jgi:hypothetical protein
MTEQGFDAGHVFFRPGDPADRAYLLHDGQVELLAGSVGSLARVGLFGPGDVFGEMALVGERPRTLIARAVTAGRFSPMGRDEFEHHLTHDPARAQRYLRSLFERLRALPAHADDHDPEPGPAEPLALPAPAAGHGPVELPHAAGRPADWAVVIHPLTPTAAANVPDDGLRVTRFPLRIGRTAGLHEPEGFDLNDLWLLDRVPYQASRNHCEVRVGRDGPAVADRGSQLGCVVNDEAIGGRARRASARLRPGDNTLVIGTRESPYQYRLAVSPA